MKNDERSLTSPVAEAAAGEETPSPRRTQPFQPLPPPAQVARWMEDPPSVTAAQSPDMAAQPGWKIRNILVPTDFSACSVEAVARAAELARRHDATLTILHVIDINPPAAQAHLGTAESLMRQLWITGATELRRLAESLAQQQIKTQTRLVEGLPAEAIVENSSGFDLLVIGEPDCKSAWQLFSRHTARRVIEEAGCAVLVVHEGTGRVGRELDRETKLAA